MLFWGDSDDVIDDRKFVAGPKPGGKCAANIDRWIIVRAVEAARVVDQDHMVAHLMPGDDLKLLHDGRVHIRPRRPVSRVVRIQPEQGRLPKLIEDARQLMGAVTVTQLHLRMPRESAHRLLVKLVEKLDRVDHIEGA